jgi:hypothetical protein
MDSYGWADPARDVANLLAYLRWRAIRQPSSTHTVARVRAAFLEGYGEAAASPLDLDSVRVFEAASMLKIVGRRYRSLAADEWERLPALLDAALVQLGDSVGRTH